ncbi:65-kDa microtubule-associated protein 8-like protein [Drosera capensis]
MRSSASVESSCGYLLQNLQCQEVYRRKVDNANIARAKLHQELAESESELTHLQLTLGERSIQGKVASNAFFTHPLIIEVAIPWFPVRLRKLITRLHWGKRRLSYTKSWYGCISPGMVC